MSKEIAQTILNQLGGNKFIAMTGAKQFVTKDNGKTLSFKIGRNKTSCNYVTITLNDKDLYDMKFERFRLNKKTYDVKWTEIATHNDVYCDMLQDIFTEVTGLYTKLF